MGKEDRKLTTDDTIPPSGDKVDIPQLDIDLNPFAQNLHQSALHLSSLPSIIVAPALETMRFLPNRLAESFKDLYGILDKTASIMLELGWPPIGDLDAAQARQIMQEYELHGADAVRPMLEKYLLWYYDDDALRAVLATWQKDKRLANRLPILTQAVEAHLAGNYFASIPTILPQIEGIIPERYGHAKGNQCFARHLLRYMPDLLATKGESFLDRWMHRFYTEVVMVGFIYGNEPESSLSRHAILHGYDTSYGTAANSLRAILVFDYLQSSLYRLVSTPRGKCYHLVGCPTVSVGTPDLVVYEHLILAQTSGKTPCKRCSPDTIEPLIAP